MFLRSKLMPALLTGLLVAGCGGSGSDTAPLTPLFPIVPITPIEPVIPINPIDPVIPLTPIIPSTSVPFSSLPKGSFSLALKRTGTGTLPGDQNIYIQLVNQPCKNSSPCAAGDTTIVTALALVPTTVTGGPNGEAILGSVSQVQADQPLTPFKLSDLINGNVILPGDAVYSGSRIYISMGKPLQMKVNPTGDGYVQTDFNNPNDPNILIPFDFVELAYDAKPNLAIPGNNKVAFGANLSQVDQFSLPLAFTITGVSDTVLSRGMTLGLGSTTGVNTRDEIVQNYLEAVTAPFQNLKQTAPDGTVVRILAPYHVASFKPGGTYATFFDNYVNDVWSYFQEFNLANPCYIYDQKPSAINSCTTPQTDNPGTKYEVYGDGNVLHIKRNDLVLAALEKPSTIDVFQNNGNLQPAGSGPAADGLRAFGALMSGALNRHVATQPENWLAPANFYPGEPQHDYAKFWHQISILNLAYGFGFDDTADQSSVAILTPQEDISKFDISIGW